MYDRCPLQDRQLDVCRRGGASNLIWDANDYLGSPSPLT